MLAAVQMKRNRCIPLLKLNSQIVMKYLLDIGESIGCVQTLVLQNPLVLSNLWIVARSVICLAFTAEHPLGAVSLFHRKSIEIGLPVPPVIQLSAPPVDELRLATFGIPQHVTRLNIVVHNTMIVCDSECLPDQRSARQNKSGRRVNNRSRQIASARLRHVLHFRIKQVCRCTTVFHHHPTFPASPRLLASSCVFELSVKERDRPRVSQYLENGDLQEIGRESLVRIVDIETRFFWHLRVTVQVLCDYRDFDQIRVTLILHFGHSAVSVIGQPARDVFG